MPLRYVFTPIRIGPVEVQNRIVRTAHDTRFGGGTLSDDLIAYHLARAKGGVGLSILEICSVDSVHSPGPLAADHPDLVAGYRRLMEAVRPYGMRVFQQLWHGGHNAFAMGAVPLSASDRPGVMVGVIPHAMTRLQIKEIVRRFAGAATRCQEGGLDGVEIHAAHGYLIGQFLSPLANERTDEYGGSLENRMRFLTEILCAVRATVAPALAVGVRLSPEGIKGGLGVHDIQEILTRLQDASLIDYANISYGNYYTLFKMMPTMSESVGSQLPTSVPITSIARVPTIVSGRFRTLEEADQVIHRGEASLVGMTRAHIADPDIVRKTREGREDEIRVCIACNHGCVAGVALGSMRCAINPAVGHEKTLAEDLIERTGKPKRVLVVGGGPAGLEAARVAALRGHKVILAEALPDLGGAINIAKAAPRRLTIGDIVEWQAREIYRLGVEVRLSTYMDGADVRAENPDVVVVATGSQPRMDGYQVFAPGERQEGVSRRHVVSSEAVILGNALPENGRAVVYDDVGHYEAIAVAETLISKGIAVTFVTGHNGFAPRLETSLTSEPALQRLAKGEFRLLTRHKIVAIENDTVSISPTYASKTERIPAGLVVLVSLNRPNRDLVDELEEFDPPLLVVGDAQSPRFLMTAIHEGHRAAREL